MGQSLYQQEALRDFRRAGAELAEFRKNAETAFEAAAITGDLKAAQDILAEASLKTQAYQELRDKLGPTGIFLAKYGVEVINEHTVLFVLPKGCSRIDILNEAQRLVPGIGNWNLIYPSRLEKWQKEECFTKLAATSERICIDGHVKGGDGKDGATQVKFLADKGLRLSSIEDLAVAFALHWVATGDSLFDWLDKSRDYSAYVRCAGGALCVDSCGLHMFDVEDRYDNVDVAVSARVFPESK
jgi:hypothetical protein